MTIGVRDAAGDFVSYAVDVTSLRLVRGNGDVVETVPLTTRIDFAEVADLTEFFTVATVPAGIYSQRRDESRLHERADRRAGR